MSYSSVCFVLCHTHQCAYLLVHCTKFPPRPTWGTTSLRNCAPIYTPGKLSGIFISGRLLPSHALPPTIFQWWPIGYDQLVTFVHNHPLPNIQSPHLIVRLMYRKWLMLRTQTPMIKIHLMYICRPYNVHCTCNISATWTASLSSKLFPDMSRLSIMLFPFIIFAIASAPRPPMSFSANTWIRKGKF
jgi:hypothetical protein